MTDMFTPEERSKIMSKIRGKNTSIELLVRKLLWKRGLRYRIHDKKLPGKPDISNKSKKTAVFLDGCFWHACPIHGSIPSTNQEFWEKKILSNTEKRAKVREELKDMGFNVLEFFQCEIKADPEKVVDRIEVFFKT
ncbi:very short patch repair protein [archaeon BMS3Abin16]|nr:very short patch repair protein [archaeon BMS3Abin16]